MVNVTYIFGAGASYPLPCSKDIPKEIDELVAKFSEEGMWLDNCCFDNLKYVEHISNFSPYPDPTIITKRRYQMDFVNDLKWLNQKSKQFGGIDDFARTAYFQKEEKELLLPKIKILTSLFFYFEQIKHRNNTRYNSFLCNILNDDKHIKDNYRILSWNYDSQIEYSMSKILEEYDICKIREYLDMYIKNVTPRFPAKIFKLNGTTDFIMGPYMQYSIDNLFHYDEINKISLENAIRNVVDLYYCGGAKLNISYAWENETDEKCNKYSNLMNSVIAETSNTEILIVIGYSFPSINREKDEEIIGNMKNLQRIYVQDPMAQEIINNKLSKIVPNDVKFFPVAMEEDKFFIP